MKRRLGLWCVGVIAAIATVIWAFQTGVTQEANRQADGDGDGYTDAQEEAWATDPLDANYHPDLETGIVGWWRFDEGNGLSVADASGNGHAGTLTGAIKPQWTSDDTGTVLTFSGGNHVSVANTVELTPQGALTVVAWVKLSPTATGQVVSKWRSGSDGSYSLSVARGRPVLELMLAGEYRPLISPVAISYSEWHQLAAVFDGREVRLYLDGARVATTHTGGPVDVIAEPLRIGQLSGNLADVGVYARALTDGDVSLLYEVSTGSSTSRALAFRSRTSLNRILALR